MTYLGFLGVYAARGGSSEEGYSVRVCLFKDDFLQGLLWEHNGMMASWFYWAIIIGIK